MVFESESLRSSSADLRLKLRKIKDLIALPQIAQQMLSLLEKGEVYFRKISRLIKEDPAFTSRVLRLLKSEAFDLPRAVERIDTNIFTLGTEVWERLVIMASVMECFHGTQYKAVRSLWAHSVLTGQWARSIGAEIGVANDDLEKTLLAGLLHDLGKLAIE